MTTDLDELLAAEPITPPTMAGAKGLPRRCKPGRHDWVKETRFNCGPDCADMAAHLAGLHQAFTTYCDNCGIPKDEAKSRMGRKVGQRAKREERHLAALYHGRRTGHHGGPDDVQTDLTNVQSKAGTGWWSKRYWAELLKLPRTGGRVPVLIVSNGEPGSLVRRFVVLDERDFRSLFGDKLLDPPPPTKAPANVLHLPWHRETVGHSSVVKIAGKVLNDMEVEPAPGIPPNTDATWIVNAANQIVAFVGNGPRQTENADLIIAAVVAFEDNAQPSDEVVARVMEKVNAGFMTEAEARALEAALPDCGFNEPHEAHEFVIADNGKPVTLGCAGLYVGA